MRPAVFLFAILLMTGNAASQSFARSRNALEIFLRLTKNTDFWSPSVITVCGGVVGLIMMALEGRNSLKRGFKKATKSRTTSHSNSHSVTIYDVPDVTPTVNFMPLYARRMSQFLSNRRRVTRLNSVTPVPVSKSQNGNECCELWRTRDKEIRRKLRGRRAKGPRLSPGQLREINNNWQLTYGLNCERVVLNKSKLDHTGSKASLVNPDKPKLVKFNDTVNIVYIDNNNKGRRMKRWSK